MNNIILLDIEDGMLDMPDTIEVPSDITKADLRIRLKLTIHYTSTEDIVIEDIYVSYFHKEDRILSYGMRAVYNIEGWAEMMKDSPSPEQIKQMPELTESVKITLGTLRGALFAKTQQTPVNKIFMPLADITSLIKHSELNLVVK